MWPGHVMLALLIVVLPNQLHLPHTFGVPGLNLFNLLFLATLAVLILQPGRASAGETLPADEVAPPLSKPLLAFYLVLGISLALALLGGSTDPYEDIAIYKTVVTYSMMYFFAYYGVRDLAGIRRLIGLILAVFLVASFEAILQGLSFGFTDYQNDRRAAGPFGLDGGSANYAGVFYSIFCTFSLAVAVFGRRMKWRWRILATACYLTGCFAIFATFSRQSFLILGVTTFLIALRRNPLLAVCAVLGMLSYPLWAPEAVIERIDMTRQETWSGQAELEQSAASRYELWGGAWEVFKEHPFGAGFNQFQEEVEPHLPDWVLARDAQNQYLLILAEAGFLGLAAFLYLIFRLFGLAGRLLALERSPEARVLGLAFGMSVVAVIMGNIYSSTFFSGEVMANFWMLAGLLSRYAVLARQEIAVAITGSAAEATPLQRARHVYARWSARQESEASR